MSFVVRTEVLFLALILFSCVILKKSVYPSEFISSITMISICHEGWGCSEQMKDPTQSASVLWHLVELTE